jgi:hypothetical protein
MLGVVLWSDVSDRKAVIWCEDQGDLAYVNASDAVLNNGEFFDAGDLVQFEVETSHTMRYANNPRLLIEKAAQALPYALKANGYCTQTDGGSAQIISLEHFRERACKTVPLRSDHKEF